MKYKHFSQYFFIGKKKACHQDRLFNWKLFKHVDILAKTIGYD